MTQILFGLDTFTVSDLKYYGIYAIINTVNNTTYIGSTSHSFLRRWREHRSELYRNDHGNEHLQRAWNKYGEESFRWCVLEVIDEVNNPHAIIDREIYYIDEYVSRGCEIYNMQPPIAGGYCNEDTRRKISERLKGKSRNMTDNGRQRIIDAAARSYPSFIHRVTGEVIHSGFNLSELCRQRQLDVRNMFSVIKGTSLSHRNWCLLEPHPSSITASLPRKRKSTGCSSFTRSIETRMKQSAMRKGIAVVLSPEGLKRKKYALSRDYHSLINQDTQEIIPAGRNVKELRRQRSFGVNIYRLLNGYIQSYKGWRLLVV